MLDQGGIATIIGAIPEGAKVEIEGHAFVEERHIQGTNMGSNRFRIDIPRYIEFYRQGRLKLDEVVTKRIKLEQINQAIEDMKKGNVARSVIVFDRPNYGFWELIGNRTRVLGQSWSKIFIHTPVVARHDSSSQVS